jgi:hypothetical protein
LGVAAAVPSGDEAAIDLTAVGKYAVREVCAADSPVIAVAGGSETATPAVARMPTVMAGVSRRRFEVADVIDIFRGIFGISSVGFPRHGEWRIEWVCAGVHHRRGTGSVGFHVFLPVAVSTVLADPGNEHNCGK